MRRRGGDVGACGRDVKEIGEGNLAGSGRADLGEMGEGESWIRALEKERQE